MTTIEKERLAKLDEIELGRGSHSPPNGEFQACVMEMASYLADEPWSDSPKCVSPVIAMFLRRWNDDLDDEGRQMLKPYAARVIGTKDDHDEERAWMAADWLIRVCTPAWMELAGVTESAEALRGLPPITKESLGGAQPTITAARSKAAAARDAARDAAGAAAGAAARAAARDAAWDAAWDAAGAAAGAAAWDAAWDAAGAAAWDAARAAARDAARDAAGAAAGAAARKKLAPTRDSLQKSACDLLDRMIEVGSDG